MDYSFHSSPYMLFVTPMHFVVFWQHLQKGKGLHAARPAKWHDTDSFLSSPSHEARRNTIICNSLPGPATVMTGGTNDTPLIEPPGADNMPNRRKGLCHKPIVSEICCRVIASADRSIFRWDHIHHGRLSRWCSTFSRSLPSFIPGLVHLLS